MVLIGKTDQTPENIEEMRKLAKLYSIAEPAEVCENFLRLENFSIQNFV